MTEIPPGGEAPEEPHGANDAEQPDAAEPEAARPDATQQIAATQPDAAEAEAEVTQVAAAPVVATEIDATRRFVWEPSVGPRAPAAEPRPPVAPPAARGHIGKTLVWSAVGVLVLVSGAIVYELAGSGSSDTSSTRPASDPVLKTSAPVHPTSISISPVRSPSRSASPQATHASPRASSVASKTSSTASAVHVAADPVLAPYLTFSSGAAGPASYQQSGSQFVVAGAGADLWTDADAYTTIYRPSAVNPGATIETEITGESGMSGYAKAGIIVRDHLTAAGTGIEGAALLVSPSGGIQLEWDDNGGTTMDQATPANGTIADTGPVYLKLVVASPGSYIGYYSTDGKTWTEVGSASAIRQDAIQDAGLFVVSHDAGHDDTVDFSGFTVIPGG